jgi:hypothetical protein
MKFLRKIIEIYKLQVKESKEATKNKILKEKYKK